jgi:hypothetical protein
MDDEQKQQLAEEIEKWKSKEDAVMGEHPLWGQQTDEEEREEQDECEFVDRIHFETVAGTIEVLLDRLMDDANARNKFLSDAALIDLDAFSTSSILSEKERAFVDRMAKRIIAEGRLDLEYGAYRPEPLANTLRRLTAVE